LEPLTRILVPVDFSPVSEPLVRLAAVVASKYSSELVLLHVIEEGVVEHVSAGYNVNLVIEEMVEEARRKLERLADSARDAGAPRVSVFGEVPVADPAPAIAGVASKIRASEVFVASRGWGLSRLFSLGSTSRLVVKLSPVPVLFLKAVRDDGRVRLLTRGDVFGGTILYAVKSGYTREAVEYLIKLASLTRSRLVLISVEENGVKAEDVVGELARRISYNGVEVEAVASKGKVHEAILKYARAVEANLIYLERRIHSGIRGLILGSTLDRILNSSELPVLVHPAAGEQRK